MHLPHSADSASRDHCLQLRAVMEGLGEDVSAEEIDEIIRRVDRNGDGQLEFDEFVSAMEQAL